MAEQMKDIKRRIKSVSSIRQITKAMELVSTAKMRKARILLDKSRPYYTSVIDSISEILYITNGVKTPLTEVRDIKKKLVIIISSDRGLAGGFNSNVIKFAEKSIDKTNTQLLVVGLKALEYFSKRNYIIDKCITSYGDSVEFNYAKEIAEFCVKKYVDKEIDAVELIYTNFKSALTQTPIKIDLLPAIGFEPKSGVKTELITYEPSAEKMLDYLIEEFIRIAVYGAFVESSASEQSARRLAMENASDNADEMIEGLSLKYNRARQANITQELTEIVSGAEALN